jgi:hypothetical protein
MTQDDQTRQHTAEFAEPSCVVPVCCWGSGGGFEGDSVAERGELGNVVAAFDIDAASVMVGPRSRYS